MSLSDTAIRLIGEYGTAITIVRKTGGDVNPVTGKRADETVTTYTSKAVVETDGLEIVKLFGGPAVSDKVILMDSTVEPEIGDKVTIDGETLTIKRFNVQFYKGLPVYYTVQLVR